MAKKAATNTKIRTKCTNSAVETEKKPVLSAPSSVRGAAKEIVMMPVSEVRPYEKNPRKNQKAVKFVKASIEKFGFKQPIIIDSNRVIVCGHTRLLAAKSLGMAEVPCIFADDLTDAQIKAYRLADNKVAEYAEWDEDLLAGELGDIVLDTFGGSGTTIIACEQLGRKARVMELDPKYCDVIIARWEQLTGEKAVKAEGV